MQEITHLHQVWLSVLPVELFSNWTVLHTVNVRLGNILILLHPGNDLEVLLLWLHS